MNSRIPRQATLPVIDALRGLAAVAVLLFHVRVNLWVGWTAIWSNPDRYSICDRCLSLLSLPAPLFGSGVMLFFVISGYCIHRPFASGANLAVAGYAWRRAWRIVPVYWAAIVFTIVVELTLHLLRAQAVSPMIIVWKSLAMIQNYGTESGQLSANPSLWSLPVEVELYIVYPALLCLWRTPRAKYALLVVACITAVGCWLSVVGYAWANGNFMKYWAVWTGGAWLAEMEATDRLPSRPWFVMVSIGAVAVVCATICIPGLHGLQHLSWGGFWFCILYWCLVARLPSSGFIGMTMHGWAIVGGISYSLYLIHFPLFCFVGALWIQQFGTKPSNYVVSLAAVVGAIPCAWLFHYLFEKPAHEIARRRPQVFRGIPSQPTIEPT